MFNQFGRRVVSQPIQDQIPYKASAGSICGRHRNDYSTRFEILFLFRTEPRESPVACRDTPSALRRKLIESSVYQGCRVIRSSPNRQEVGWFCSRRREQVRGSSSPTC